MYLFRAEPPRIGHYKEHPRKVYLWYLSIKEEVIVLQITRKEL